MPVRENFVENRIELHPKSVEYMDEVMEQYTESDGSAPRDYPKGVILHMYPTKDVYDKKGNLCGYQDGLLFRLRIFDQATKKVYTYENRDAITLDYTADYMFVRVFKDMSTMVVIRGPVALLITQNVYVKSMFSDKDRRP